MIKGIQRYQPTRPDSRQPITLDILTKCIHTLRSGYRPINTARTLDAMFILAFFGFLRCSELAITSKFNPKIHPTISDLSILDSETISFLIKQSKTDQARKGHFIYIFNLPSSIQPYQTVLAYIQSRNSQAKSPIVPLFLDDSNKPATFEIICSAFPHRRRELNDYLALIAELALSYGGGHFYTYHLLVPKTPQICSPTIRHPSG